MSRGKKSLSLFLSLIGLIAAGYLFSAALKDSNAYQQVASTVKSETSKISVPDLSQFFPDGSGSSTSGSSTTTQPNTQTSSATSFNTTSNWAGYAVTGGSYTSVSGTWTVPNASGSGETSADATWVGIGGISSSDLIQVGTQNIISSDGQVDATAFYEMLPDASVDITNVDVNPGDSITASVKEISDGYWKITLTDNTDGQSFSTNVEYDSSLSSAEWIEEDPSDGYGQMPFDDFGSMTLTGGSTTVNGTNETIAGANAQAISMINGDGEALTSTSALSSNGSDFTVTRTDASSGSAVEEYNTDPFSVRWHGNGIGREYEQSFSL
jgi:hypothetical protein